MRHLIHGLTLVVLLALSAVAQEPFYEIDSLNAGLPPPPPTVERRTAYGAMASFIDETEAERPELAAHLLNLSDIPVSDQARRGPELARRLAVVIDRKILVPWDDLLDRPDNLDANAPDREATGGEPRQSILIGRIDNGRRDGAIRLNRVKPEDGDPVWVFSRETVNQIDAFYAKHGPTQLERALPDQLRQETIMGLALWELIGLPVLLICTILTGRLSFWGFKRLSLLAKGTVASIALDSMRWPSVIAIVTTLLLVSTNYIFTFSGAISAVIQPLIVIGYIVAILLFGLRLIDTVMAQFVTFDMGVLSEHDRDESRSLATGMSAVRRALIVIATMVSLGIILTSAQIFSAFGLSILASAGALTLILGFAARPVLGNIMASLQIAINRSARIGDQIEYEGKWCTVERIHFTFVQLKIWNGDRFVVPVEHFVSDSFINFTLNETAQIRTIKLTLAHSVDFEAMRARFKELLAEQDGVSNPDEAMLLIVSHDAFGAVARFQFPCPDPNTGWIAECELREKLILAAQELDTPDRPALPQGHMDDMGT